MSKKIIFIYIFLFVFFPILKGQNLAKIYGTVTDLADSPIENATVVVKGNVSLGTATNVNGRFDLLIPHDKDLVIEISCVGYESVEQTVNVPKGKRKEFNFQLKESVTHIHAFTLDERYAIDNEDLKTINPKVLTHIPGTNVGVESLVKSAGLGVFANNELTSQYNVRGGNYDENLIYLNGIEVFRPFLIRSGNQEGLSFINPDLVSAVHFSSGGFDACYGDKMSSVLNVKYKTPTRWAGGLSGSLRGASGHLEGVSKDKKLSFLLGVRYQSNASVFKKTQDSGFYRPNFWDGQFFLNYTPNKKWTISLFGNYANNIYKFRPASRNTIMGAMNNAKSLTIYFEGQEVDAYQTIYSSLLTKYRVDSNHTFSFSVAYFNSTEKETFDILSEYYLSDVNSSFGSNDFGERYNSRSVGSDLHHGRNFLVSDIFYGGFNGEHHLPKRNTLSWGVKFQGEFIADKLTEWRAIDSSGYTLPFQLSTPGDSVAIGDSLRLFALDDNTLKVNNTLATFRLTGFVMDKWQFGKDKHLFTLVGGLRFGFWSFNKEFLFCPRLRLVYMPQHLKHDISFYLATGMYAQPPVYKEMRQKDGSLNEHIKSQLSYHFITGLNLAFEIARRPFQFSVEVYYKYLDNIITYSVDNVRITYSGRNDAVGYAVGIDAKLSGEIVHNLESWLSVSLMKSMESIDHEVYTPRPTDQRFSVNLFFQDRIPRLPMIKAHLNLVYATPLPYSFKDKRVYDRRSKAYFRTDLGISWQFLNQATHVGKKNPFKFINAAFLSFEITNLFNYYNVLSYLWISDIDNQYYAMPNYMLPRMFNLKLRFEF